MRRSFLRLVLPALTRMGPSGQAFLLGNAGSGSLPICGDDAHAYQLSPRGGSEGFSYGSRDWIEQVHRIAL